jgi:hypothetical protein
MEDKGEGEEEEDLQLITEKIIEIAKVELPDCTTRDETWNLIEDEFMEGRLRAMKKWLEEIKNRFRQGKIDEEKEIRKLE